MQSPAEQLRTFYRSGSTRPLARRMEALRHLKTAIENHKDEILAALHADLGKSAFEAYVTEVAPALAELDAFLRHGKCWLKPEKVKSPLLMFPSKTFVVRDPHGVILLLAPWNYPFHLFMVPFIGMIACGNTVLGKPSRRSPATTAVLEKIIGDVFPQEWARVSSEVDLDDAYDYIFFTGGITTGKMIAERAAKTLTPVTLELGGKNACVVDDTADLTVAARRIAWAKCINAGQTCVAPDYLLVQASVKDVLVEKIAA
ncbi:MAG: aldehyde dehydrogenase family protein, partial [Methanocorpusculum sp.]|nr:aldehyde dehydrogenase family protein [Methanocorpusculum sp.]